MRLACAPGHRVVRFRMRSTLASLALIPVLVAVQGCSHSRSAEDGGSGVDGGGGGTDGGGGGTDGGGGGTDGGGGGTDGGAGGTDGGGGGGPDGVRCVGAEGDSCPVGQVCCGGALEITCEPPTGSCVAGAIACDGSEDCPDAFCCGSGGGTMCASVCEGQRICHARTECNSGEDCCPNGGGIPNGALMHCLALDPGTSCPLPP